MNLTEAFQKMDLLESEDFDISSPMDAADLRNFIDEDEIDDSIDIVDLQAEEEEELEDSYIGKVITECCVCHSKFYKDPSEIVIDEETGNCNIEDECPVCYSHDGYKVIGKVAPYEEVPEMEDEIEVEVDEKPVEIETEEDDIEESLNESTKKHLCSVNEECDDSMNECDTQELDETIGGTLAGAALGAAVGHPIRGALIGSGISNELAGKGSHAANYAKMAGGATGKVGTAIKGAIGGAVAGNKVADVASKTTNAVKKSLANKSSLGDNLRQNLFGDDAQQKLTMAMKKNGIGDSQIQSILSSLVNESLEESFESASIETEDQVMSMSTTENGGVTITAEPKEAIPGEGEMIAPLDAEDEKEITGVEGEDGLDFSQEEIATEEAPAEDEIDMEEVDEESFDDLGESYLKRVYENVNSFKTDKVYKKGNKLVVEGLINFTSGKTKKTSFMFEAYKKTQKGKIKFIGENVEITKGKKAFTLTGRIDNKRFITESLNYNYRQKDSEGKSTKLYGTVRRK